MDKLKILILNYEYPPLGGGAGIMTKRLAKGFAQLGHQVEVITTFFQGEEELSKDGDLVVRRLKSKRKRKGGSNPIEMYAWMRAANQYCQANFSKGDFDVCLANFTLPGGNVAKKLKAKIDLPYFVLSHGHDIPWFFPKQMFFYHAFLYPIIKQICLQSEKNIVLTDDMKRNADRFLGAKHQAKNVVIPNGLDFNFSELALKEEELNILFVGRMVDQKDPLQFLAAVRQLNNQNLAATYKMLGDGPLMPKVKDYIAKYKLQNVILMRKVNHDVVLKEMQKAHLMIQPSLHEAMSISVLEAISSGVYVISTPVSGNKQLIIDGLNGKLVPYNDVEAIVQEVKRFHDEDMKDKIAKYPLSYMEDLKSKYSWDYIVQQYLALFKAVQ